MLPGMPAMATKPFIPGDRIIFDGEYIGVLREQNEHGNWTVNWEDDANEGTLPTYPPGEMVFANGGRSSAQRGRHKYDVVEAPPYTFHCTDRDPDHCACATDEGSDCVLCGESTDGYTTLNIIRQINPFLPEDEAGQEWETITRHKNCDEAKEEES